jgi:WD40 repeat protein
MKLRRLILIATVAALAAVTFQGCIVPNVKPIKGAEDVAPIKIGETTREQVVTILGEPNVSADDRLLVYNWEKSRYFWVVGAGYSAVGGDAGLEGFRVAVELDATGRVGDFLTADSTEQPKLLPEDWVGVKGCGMIRLPNAIAVSHDADRIAALVRSELCLVMAGKPESARRIDLGKVPFFGGLYGSFIAFSPDDSVIAIAASGQLPKLIDITSGKVIGAFGTRLGQKQMKHLVARPVAFSPDGSGLAAPDVDGSLVVWETATGAELLRHPAANTGSIAFSPDGSLIAVGLGGGAFKVLNVSDGRILQERSSVPGTPLMTAVAFSPDGRWLAVGTPVHAELWETPGLHRHAVFLLPFFKHAPAYNIYRQPVAGFSPDGRNLAVIVHEMLTMIDTERMAVGDVYRFRFPVMSAAFDPDWKRMAVLSANGIRLWEAPVTVQE